MLLGGSVLELELLGLHNDGNYLVLTAEDGSRYTLLINDALRAAVRKDRPHLEAIHAANSSLSVKDIQKLIRAGASVEEIAVTYDLSIERLHKYERPILAERAWAAERALSCRINGELDAPLLGDIVIDRLAARGVDPNLMEWTAIKKNDDPWEIILTFVQGTIERQAHWSMEENGNGIFAIDEEAHWLTETAMPPTIPDIVVPISSTQTEDEKNDEDMPENTQQLLDQLSANRGIRQNADIYGEDITKQTQNHDVDNVIALSNISQINNDQTEVNLFGALPNIHKDEDKQANSYNTEENNFHIVDSENYNKDAQNINDEITNNQLEDTKTQLSLPIIKTQENKMSASSNRKPAKRQSVPTWDEIVFGGRTK